MSFLSLGSCYLLDFLEELYFFFLGLLVGRKTISFHNISLSIVRKYRVVRIVIFWTKQYAKLYENVVSQ